jgi:hypothetical protein
MRGRRPVMPRFTATTPITLAPLAPLPPTWVEALLGPTPTVSRTDIEDGTLDVRTGTSFTHVAVTIPKADGLAPDVLHARVRNAYLSVAATLNAQQRHPVRFWNFVPRIHTPSGADLDRYMIFNGGRFAACEHWHGSPNAFDHTLASVSRSRFTAWQQTMPASPWRTRGRSRRTSTRGGTDRVRPALRGRRNWPGPSMMPGGCSWQGRPASAAS